MVAVENIAGFDFSTLSLAESVSVLRSWVTDPEPGAPRLFVCGNPHSLEVARHDAPFAAALHGSEMLIADGLGVVIASKMRGGRIRMTVGALDVFRDLSRELSERHPGTRVFFLGASEETLAEMQRRYHAEFPHLAIAGARTLPQRSESTAGDDMEVVSQINRSAAQVLWIGLDSPEQETWAFRNRYRLEVKLIAPIGAMFDFYTGRRKMPPLVLQRLGLVWLFSFVQDPRRRLQRQINNAVFLFRILFNRTAP